MTRIIHPELGHIEDVTDFNPYNDTHLLEKYLLQVVDDLHKDPWGHRSPRKCPSRRLKIVPLHRCWGTSHANVPAINLNGNWLSTAGFEMQQHVRVFLLKKTLVICPDEEYIKDDIKE